MLICNFFLFLLMLLFELNCHLFSLDIFCRRYLQGFAEMTFQCIHTCVYVVGNVLYGYRFVYVSVDIFDCRCNIFGELCRFITDSAVPQKRNHSEEQNIFFRDRCIFFNHFKAYVYKLRGFFGRQLNKIIYSGLSLKK